MIAALARFAPARSATMTLAVVVVLLGVRTPCRASFITVNFDTTPSLAPGPTTFPATAQAITVAGVGTFSGGALVSTPTSLASFTPGGGTGNAYGTASIASSSYATNLTLTAAAGVTFSTVSGTLFNGYADLVTYSVLAYSGLTFLGTTRFDNVEDSSDPAGYRNFSASGQGITRLVFTPDLTFSAGAFDYFLDNVSIIYAATTAVPEPASLALVALGLPAVLVARRRWSGITCPSTVKV